jgi:hypothetical protein
MTCWQTRFSPREGFDEKLDTATLSHSLADQAEQDVPRSRFRCDRAARSFCVLRGNAICAYRSLIRLIAGRS